MVTDGESERLWRVALGAAGRERLEDPEVAPFAAEYEHALVEHRRRYSASSLDAVEGALARLVGAVDHAADTDAAARGMAERARERRAVAEAEREGRSGDALPFEAWKTDRYAALIFRDPSSLEGAVDQAYGWYLRGWAAARAAVAAEDEQEAQES